MSSIKRTMERKRKKKAKKDLKEKVALFGKLGDECMTCEKPFDKKDREQVESWNVVVRKDINEVRLYCPECWEKALAIVKDFREHLEKKNAN